MRYELAAGKPPFKSNMLQDLIREIIDKDVPKVEGFSPAFNDLVQGLLAKDPVNRFSWQQVLNHPFWECDFTMRDLPQQPQFNQYLMSHGIDPTQFENSRIHLRTPVPIPLDDQVLQSPAAPVQGGATAMLGKAPAAPPVRAPSRKKDVDIMRLSYNVRKHMDGEDTQYQPNEEQNKDVKLENRDQELNFGEKGDEDDDEEPASGEHVAAADDSMQEDEKMEKLNLKTEERAAATVPFTTQMLQKPNSTER